MSDLTRHLSRCLATKWPGLLHFQVPTVKETDIEIIKMTDDDEMINNSLLLQLVGVWLVVDIDLDYIQPRSAGPKLNLTVLHKKCIMF